MTSSERTWLSVGEDFAARLGKRSVEHTIESMEWEPIPENGSLSLGAMPGMAIKTVIEEFGLPKVSAVAVSGFERPGFYPGFYGIEANYSNGRARLYVLDTGTGVTPIVSDFEAKVEAA